VELVCRVYLLALELKKNLSADIKEKKSLVLGVKLPLDYFSVDT
jgi:hypothetical protein